MNLFECIPISRLHYLNMVYKCFATLNEFKSEVVFNEFILNVFLFEHSL